MKYLECLKKYYIYFVCYAVIGWIYELFFFLFEGQLVNRGFLMGPYLPIYGIGALFIILFLKSLKNKKVMIKKINIMPIIIFILIFLITTIVEYVGHFVLNEFFNISLWDYSGEFLNINGRVCFFASRNFAIMGTLGIYFVHPWLESKVNKLQKREYNVLFFTLLFVIIIDFVFSILNLIKYN